MAKPFNEQELQSVDTDFIISKDVVAEKLLKEIYSNLKHKPFEDLSIAEHCWISSIENLYQNEKRVPSTKLSFLLQAGKELIENRKEISQNEKAIVRSFMHLLQVSVENDSLTKFFDEFEKSVESLFRLNFSHETNIPLALEINRNDLLHYIVMTVEMVRERLSQTVVSNKVVRSILSRISDMGFLVTDELGIVRFANDKMGLLVGKLADELIGESIKNYVSPDQTLLNTVSDVKPEEFEIHQVKVPSTNGEIDEWIYTFSPKLNEHEKNRKLSDVKSVIYQLAECDKNDHGKMDELLETLQSKFAQIEGVDSYSNGFSKSGVSIKTLIDNCLSEADLAKCGVDLTVDADDILYFGEEEKLRHIFEQMLSCACENLTQTSVNAKMRIVVSRFDRCLDLTCSDNGPITSKYSLIKTLRKEVEAIHGTFELKSGITGNTLNLRIPI